MKKFSFLLIFTLFYLLVAVNTVKAADRKVVCKKNDCKIDSDLPLFQYDNVFPSWSESKSVDIQNKYPNPINSYVVLKNDNFKDTDLDSVIEISIKNGTTLVYGPKSLKEFAQNGNVKLGAIPNKNTQTFVFTLTMLDVDNDYQALRLYFDLDFNFEAEEVTGNNNNGTKDKDTKSTLQDVGDYVSEILGITAKPNTVKENSKIETEPKKDKTLNEKSIGEVLGENTCRVNYYWLFLFIPQVMLLTIILLFSKTKWRILASILAILSAVLIYISSCGNYYWVVSLILGLLSFLKLRNFNWLSKF